jgi:hypothetical protein
MIAEQFVPLAGRRAVEFFLDQRTDYRSGFSTAKAWAEAGSLTATSCRNADNGTSSTADCGADKCRLSTAQSAAIPLQFRHILALYRSGWAA